MSSPSYEKVLDLLHSFHTAMLVTHVEDSGALRARPMEIAGVDDEGHVWFFTDGTSPKIDEIRQEQQVLLTFQKDHQKYLSFAGTARIVTDRAKIESLWKEPYRVWFPGGLENPDLALVRIIPEYADYWDNSGIQGGRYLYEAAKALIKGTTPDLSQSGIHGHVRTG